MSPRSPGFIVWLLLAVATSTYAGSPASPPHSPSSPPTAPLIVAHRGFSAEAPENTLISYKMAIDLGVEMAECDVYTTCDGTPVCMHDETVDRTTNGSGPVTTKTLAQLRKLDAGSWKDARFAGEPVPTLEELLRLVDGKLRLVIEIKQPCIEANVLRAIRDAGVSSESLMIFSFDYDTVHRIAQCDPLLPTTWLLSEVPDSQPARTLLIRRALAARVSAIGMSHQEFDAQFARRLKQTGMPVFVWTVNDPAAMRELANAGVDAIITDRPDVAQQALPTATSR